MFSLVMIYGPLVVALLVLATYVVPSRYRVRSQAVWAMVLLLAAMKFIAFRSFGSNAYAPDLPAPVIWGWNWLYSCLFVLFAVSLAALPVYGVLRRVAASGRQRRALRMTWRIVLPTVACIVGVVGVSNGVKAPEIKTVTMTFADLPETLEGYRIVQISDLHISSAARRWRTSKVVDLANSVHPDMIAVTGDIVDGSAMRQWRNVEPLKELVAHDGVWFVIGNHERYNKLEEWGSWYTRWKLRFLDNETVFPRKDLVLAGVSEPDVRWHHEGAIAQAEKHFASATNGEFRILLEHRPMHAEINLSGEDAADLQLSGHTHGGVMPVLKSVIAGWNGGFVRGEYEIGGKRLYVSPGAGQWSGFPMRLCNDSEITLIVLTRGEKKED